MKTFFKENWYKLMTGISMLITAFAFLIFSIIQAKADNIYKSESAVTTGYPEGEYVYFITNGYFYRVKKGSFSKAFKNNWWGIEPETYQYKKIE
jgi:hypothetical protein